MVADAVSHKGDESVGSDTIITSSCRGSHGGDWTEQIGGKVASKMDGDGRQTYGESALRDFVMRQARRAWILFEFCASAMLATPCATKIGCVFHLRGKLGFF